ncbi:Lsr2 family protein [Kitasatospora sp. MBT66]|uniref:histone-like nucleoid-structuring protein Lsr2 n=1 Tax=Kitasatospora sp. MBT66 TaxID=1444769 RepID=UPI0005BCFC14|nr:Lsr2 family protein [Kitasatospora sp. MBT66]
MAVIETKTTQVKDDLSGEIIDQNASDSFRFGFDGVNFELDSSLEAINKIREFLAPYAAAARIVEDAPVQVGFPSVAAATRGQQQPRKRAAATPVRSSGPDPAKVREWARAQGLEVNERGRLSSGIVEAYEKAHG